MTLMIRLALRDLARDRVHLICNIAVIVGIVLPILVLFGVKNGVYNLLIGRLMANPATLQIDTSGNHSFTEDQLEITSEQNSLVISGRQQDDSDDRSYLHRGIAARDFERKFQLAEHVKVVAAKLENGLLHVALEREIPEAMKPRKIAIERDSGSSLLQNQKAA